jgi:hypothetical protein
MMSRLATFAALASLVVLATTLLLGCGDQRGTEKPAGTNASPAKTSSAGTEPSSAAQSGLAELSEADRAAALKQMVCPVSGEELGGMGKPPKVTLEGREVFLCCSACEKTLRKDPKKYLAKLDAK